MAPQAPTKFLVCGLSSSVSSLSSAIKRASAVHASSAGPFSLLILPFLPPPSTPLPTSNELDEVLGNAPIEVILITPAESTPLREGDTRSWSVYAGTGITTHTSGLRIAYCMGRYDKLSFEDEAAAAREARTREFELGAAEVNGLIAQGRSKGGNVFAKVPDILMTYEWPEGVGNGATATLDAGQPKACDPLANLAMALEPRYHFAVGPGLFYARDPYLNPAGHVTRFIGLGHVGNHHKRKWIHALGLVPAARAERGTLLARAPGTTPCPFLTHRAGNHTTKGNGQGPPAAKRARLADSTTAAEAGVTSIYIGNLAFNAEEADLLSIFRPFGEITEVRMGRKGDGRPAGFAHLTFQSTEGAQKALGLHGQNVLGRELRVDIAAGKNGAQRNNGANQQPGPLSGVHECCFCLSSASADSRLVVSIANDTYTALDKGGLAEYHTLVVPIEHVPSSMALSAPVAAELKAYLGALRRCYAAKLEKKVICFERYVQLRRRGGNHAHINVIPISDALCDGAEAAIRATVEAAGLDLLSISQEEMESGGGVREHVGTGEFLSFTLPDGSGLVHRIKPGEKHPLSLGREAIARALQTPEKADWKNCLVSPEQEEKMANSFKEFFKEYDIMQAT